MNLSTLIIPAFRLHKASRGILSVLPENFPKSSYDGRARLYDVVVGSKLYNKLIWGTSIKNYRLFAQQALASGDRHFLDAGSGSAVFTAEEYAASEREIILADLSLGMLRKAQKRISRVMEGQHSEHIAFIQADLFDLPFHKKSFPTVLSMGMLHLFDEAGKIITKLLQFVEAGGHLYLSSLVNNRKTGRRYLSLLHKAGEVAKPRSYEEVNAVLESISGISAVETRLEGNMMYIILTKAG